MNSTKKLNFTLSNYHQYHMSINYLYLSIRNKDIIYSNFLFPEENNLKVHLSDIDFKELINPTFPSDDDFFTYLDNNHLLSVTNVLPLNQAPPELLNKLIPKLHKFCHPDIPPLISINHFDQPKDLFHIHFVY